MATAPTISDLFDDDAVPLRPEEVAALHARYLAGDLAAGHRLANSLWRWVLAFISRVYPRLPVDEAFAVASARVWVRLRHYDTAKGSLSGWAAWQTRSAVSRWLEQKDRHSTGPGPLGKRRPLVRLDAEIAGPSGDNGGGIRLPDYREAAPDARIELADEHRAADAMLDDIGGRGAEILRAFANGETATEICARTGMARKTVTRAVDQTRHVFRCRWERRGNVVPRSTQMDEDGTDAMTVHAAEHGGQSRKVSA